MAIEQKKFTYTPFTYKDYEKSAEVTAAEQKKTDVENAIAKYGQFQWKDQDKYNALLQGYENRPDFTYDFNADALYQQYKDKYISQGKMAMQDTMGQAAAMTGGYGNSYAQSVGQQAYQSSLDNLNNIIPELYQMAYDRYNQKGQDMLNNIALYGNERDFALGLHNDGYNKLVNDRNYYSTEADNAFNRDYGIYADANAFNQWLAEYNLNDRQVALQEKEYANKYDSTTKEYSGTTKTGSSYNNGSLTSAQVKQLQAALGVTADGYYGSVSSKAAGGLSAEEAYKKFVGGKIDKQGDQSTGFTGSSYSDAVSYMKANGVPSANASGVMTAQEWSRRKASHSASGTGNSEVKNYSNYQEYLQAFVEYAVENYGK